MDLSNVATMFVFACFCPSICRRQALTRDCRQARLASLIINIEMEYTFMQTNLGGQF